MRGRMGVVAVGLSVVLVFGACTPGGAEPSGSDTSSATPMASVSATPSSDPEMDALYAEAEQVFWRSLELRFQSEMQPQENEFPEAELSEVLSDPYLSWVRGGYEYLKEQGWHAPEGLEPTVVVAPYPGASRDGSVIALYGCMDTRQIPALDSSGEVVSEGKLYRLELFFKYFDGQMKLFEGDSREMTECSIV